MINCNFVVPNNSTQCCIGGHSLFAVFSVLPPPSLSLVPATIRPHTSCSSSPDTHSPRSTGFATGFALPHHTQRRLLKRRNNNLQINMASSSDASTRWNPPPGRHSVYVGGSLGRALRARKGQPPMNKKTPVTDYYLFKCEYHLCLGGLGEAGGE